MELESRLVQKILNSGCKEVGIILNGNYLYYHGKIVYAHVIQNKGEGSLVFYVKKSSKKEDKEYVDNYLERVEEQLLSNSLYGVSLDIPTSVELLEIKVCQQMKLLVLESVLYNAARIVSEAKKNKEFALQIGSYCLTTEDTRELQRVFLENSYTNYCNLVYQTGNNRFINNLLSIKKFYKTMKTFVPVFIDFKYVFNPFRFVDVTHYRLYKDAVAKGRFVSNDILSCYFLTHEEICKAFGMKSFVRFTPNFCYKVFVGLLNPTLVDFPNVTTTVVVSMKPVTGLKLSKIYSEDAYYATVQSIENKIQATSNESDKKVLEERLFALKEYVTVDSMQYHVWIAHRLLTTFGPYVLDDPKEATAAKIYTYLKEASLLV